MQMKSKSIATLSTLKFFGGLGGVTTGVGLGVGAGVGNGPLPLTKGCGYVYGL